MCSCAGARGRLRVPSHGEAPANEFYQTTALISRINAFINGETETLHSSVSCHHGAEETNMDIKVLLKSKGGGEKKGKMAINGRHTSRVIYTILQKCWHYLKYEYLTVVQHNLSPKMTLVNVNRVLCPYTGLISFLDFKTSQFLALLFTC